MATETIGKYQLHLLAYELPGGKGWEPFLTIDLFKDNIQDFVCVLEKYRVSHQLYPSYEAAIEAARRAGNDYVSTLPKER